VPAPNILIAGAGIGGLTTAIALARRGIAVTLVEKRSRFAENGAGIQIAPNAGHVLDGLGLALPLKRVSVSLKRLAVRRWRDDAVLAAMPMTETGAATPFRALKRADLHMVLLDAARAMPNIRFVIGRGLDGVAQTETGVVATLIGETGQAETIAALGLVGADGLWSRLRDLIDAGAEPRFTGYEAWRAVIPAPAAKAAALPAEVTLHIGRGRHAVHYPVAGGRETNLVVVREAREARPGWSRDGEAKLLRSHVAGSSQNLRALVQAARDWQVWSLYDRPPAAMAKGRLALLGDAAHPVLPFMAQGAALAIEDAAVLARHLAEHLERDGAAGVSPAFAAYAAERSERVARVQEASRANGAAYHLGWPRSAVRDLVMRRLGEDGMRRRNGWLYDWRQPA
jgi:salicylate hydroxylase